MNKAEEHINKGTTTVGIVCKEGIVLGADKRVTLGGAYVSHKSFDKVYKITENLAITTAGTVSDVQLITKLIKAELSLRRIRTGSDATVREAANLFSGIVYQNIRKFSPILGVTGFLLGGKDRSGFALYEIGPDGSVMLHEKYAVDGSGMMMCWGVLDTLYKPDLSISEGTDLAVKTISAAMQRDTATGEGIDIVTITKDGVKKVLTKIVESKLS
ncbi:proteasome subunit beta [Candidatus Woesearchaeota archaeon]|nr:proteasome subunit beta [Candidatus Woesearchaeota archaeon]